MIVGCFSLGRIVDTRTGELVNRLVSTVTRSKFRRVLFPSPPPAARIATNVSGNDAVLSVNRGPPKQYPTRFISTFAKFRKRTDLTATRTFDEQPNGVRFLRPGTRYYCSTQIVRDRVTTSEMGDDGRVPNHPLPQRCCFPVAISDARLTALSCVFQAHRPERQGRGGHHVPSQTGGHAEPVAQQRATAVGVRGLLRGPGTRRHA